MRRGLIILFGAALFLLLMGCSENTQPSMQNNDTEIIIQTNLGNLYYPLEWKELLSTTEKKTDFGTSVTFQAEKNGEKLELFTLNIGGGAGDEIGQLTDRNGSKHAVRVSFQELNTEGMDEQTANQFFAMQEDINYLVEHLK